MKQGNRYLNHNAPVLAELVEEKLINLLQVGYAASKEGVKTPWFNLVERVLTFSKV